MPEVAPWVDPGPLVQAEIERKKTDIAHARRDLLQRTLSAIMDEWMHSGDKLKLDRLIAMASTDKSKLESDEQHQQAVAVLATARSICSIASAKQEEIEKSRALLAKSAGHEWIERWSAGDQSPITCSPEAPLIVAMLDAADAAIAEARTLRIVAEKAEQKAANLVNRAEQARHEARVAFLGYVQLMESPARFAVLDGAGLLAFHQREAEEARKKCFAYESAQYARKGGN